MSTTPNMGMTLPDVQVTPGPTYAQENNDAFEVIDSHDHTSGKGLRITPAAMNINADLDFASFGASDLDRVEFHDRSSNVTQDRSVFVKNGEFYLRDGNGNIIQLTNGGAIAVTGNGINGLTSPASADYSTILKTFTWTYDSGKAAQMAMGDILLYPYDGSTAFTNVTTLKADPANNTNTVTLPKDTGTIGTDFGAVPIGAIVACFSIYSGIGGFTIPASGTASNGWMRCDGANVPAGQAITAGTATPDLSSNVFIMGDASGNGISGGANSLNIDHTHSIKHVHIWGGIDGSATTYSQTNIDTNRPVSAFNNTAFQQHFSHQEGFGSAIFTVDMVISNATLYTTGVVSPPNGSNGDGAYSGAMSASSTIDNRPKWVNAVYLIRVK